VIADMIVGKRKFFAILELGEKKWINDFLRGIFSWFGHENASQEHFGGSR